MKDQAHYPPVDAVKAGLAGRCPRCGQGRMFSSFLKIANSCRVCGLDYDFADAGDGPAVFVILIIGFIVVGLALYVEVQYQPSLLVHFLLWIPLASVLSLFALHKAKGLLIALQYRNKAAEGKLEAKSD